MIDGIYASAWTLLGPQRLFLKETHMTDAFMIRTDPSGSTARYFGLCRSVAKSSVHQPIQTSSGLANPFMSVEHQCPSVRESMGHFAHTFLTLERKGKEAFKPTGSVQLLSELSAGPISDLQLICRIISINL